jgi:serine/threonine protein kinase
LLSAKKSKRFVPTTPAKKNKSHASHEIYSPFANIIHFSDELLMADQRDLKSKFCKPSKKMVVTTQQLNKSNRFIADFEIISKVGEGTFG